MEKILGYLMRVNENTGQVCKGSLVEVFNNLGALQSCVGGRIEVMSVNEEIDAILNDDGKMTGLPYNRALVNGAGEADDLLAGNILCVRHNKAGEFTSIFPEDVKTIQRYLKPIRVVGNSIIILPNEDSLSEYGEDV